MKTAKLLPSLQYLNECFRYSEDGKLFWKPRPLEHFVAIRGYNQSLSKSTGRPVGCIGNHGYLSVRLTVDGKSELLLVHRVVWVMHNNQIPEGYIVDHKDTNRLNNRINNLRLALPVNSSHNTSLRTDNTSGVKGVVWDKQRNLWQARINVCHKTVYIGHYTAIEDATIAIEKSRSLVHKDFANHGTGAF